MTNVIDFPVSPEYLEFQERSHIILKHLLDVFSRLQMAGALTMKNFESILTTYNIDLYRDLTVIDFAIMKFHCDNYYNLGSYFNTEND